MSGLSAFGFAQDEALTVSTNGNVGIDNSTPTEKLDVNGNIKSTGRVMDSTGYVMSVGSVIAFIGTTAPEGWVLCDGSSYDLSSNPEYSELAQVTGQTGSLVVPDLRGQFLRGLDSRDATKGCNDSKSFVSKLLDILFR